MKKIVLALSTFFGAGYLPWMPGTFGSLGGVLVFYFLKDLSSAVYAVTLVTLIVVSSWICTAAEIFLSEKDSQRIVLDEVVGILVTMAFVPFSLKSILIGFVLFRLFDTWKPWPVRWFQDNLSQGWGVMGDDVMAGIYANLILHVILRFS